MRDAVASGDPYRRSIEMFQAATPPTDAPIEEWRRGFEEMCATFDVPLEGRFETVVASGVAGLLTTAPRASADHLILHFHSGGYVMGSAEAYRNFAFRLSAAAGASVLVPDYRLAPEHPYPAAIDDAVAAYRWCRDRWPSAKIAVSGDSAGGGLAVALLMALRDQGESMPAAGIMISPLLDLAGEGASCEYNASTDPLIDRNMIVEMGKVYIGDRDPHQTPLASPLWGTHYGLPPLYLTASRSEVLRDDAVRLQRSVSLAGGVAELSLPEGLVHIWTMFPFIPEAGQSLSEIGAFARKHLGI